MKDQNFERQLHAFAADLKTLRIECGNPTLRQIEKESRVCGPPVSSAAVSETLGGKRLPRIEFLVSLVRTLLGFTNDATACTPVSRDHPQVEIWRGRWNDLRRLQTHTEFTPETEHEPLKFPIDRIRDFTITEFDQSIKSEERRASLRDLRNITIPLLGRKRAPTSAELAVLHAIENEFVELPLQPLHTEAVYVMDFSPNGALLATGSQDGTVRRWDPETGMPIRGVTGHTGSVRALKFSPIGTLLASTGEDGKIWLLKPSDGTPIRHLNVGSGVLALAFSPDGSLLATGGESGAVSLWHPITGEPSPDASHRDSPVQAMVFSPDGTALAIGSRDGSVRLWSPSSGQPDRNLVGHTGPVHAMVYSPRGTLLATAGGDGKVRLLDPNTGNAVREHIISTEAISAMAFSPDSTLLAVGGGDGVVHLWNPSSGQSVRNLTGHSDPIHAVAFSPDGTLLVTGGGGGMVRRWAVPDFRERSPAFSSSI